MPHARSKDLPAVGNEFANADLGDIRRTRRLQHIAERADSNPGAGFPQMVASDSELEGIYRLLSNEDVSPDEVLDPHIEATLDRAEAARMCIVIHDTTSFSFGGHASREGLGMLSGNGHEQGFFAHVSLAVLPDDARTPLGVCALRRLRRFERTGAWKHGEVRQGDPNRESLRWEQQIELVEKRCGGRFSAVHVADREADIFDVLALATRLKAGFVIRGHHDRTLADAEDERLLERVRALVPMASKTIELSARHDRGRPLAQRSKHPARKARNAVISVASCPVSLARPYQAHATQDAIDVNVVRVWEHDPVDGEPPVEWILYTSERVDTVEQMFGIVDIYRCRWVIEEFFKALKTGCAFEKRQLESFHALSNALSLFIPVAWKMLLARSLARNDENAPATTLLTAVQLQLLRFRFELTEPITTAKEATYAIAKLGGHLRRNGMPGWQTLARGFEALLLMQVGWRAALQAQTARSGA
jgi:hypothetical protein